MNPLTSKVLVQFARDSAMHGLFLFIPAWSFDFWEAWAFLIVFFVPHGLMSIYFARRNPALAERRLDVGPRTEHRLVQKWAVSMAGMFVTLSLICAGLDHRFGWSNVPSVLVMVADGVILLGFWVLFSAFKANSYASAVVAVFADQKVVTTGPYAIVRHPMYARYLATYLAVPVALGSWVAVPFGLAMFVMIVLRLIDEEEFLYKHLENYEQYCKTVKYRLMPRVW